MPDLRIVDDSLAAAVDAAFARVRRLDGQSETGAGPARRSAPGTCCPG